VGDENEYPVMGGPFDGAVEHLPRGGPPGRTVFFARLKGSRSQHWYQFNEARRVWIHKGACRVLGNKEEGDEEEFKPPNHGDAT
jgi:hypothetical protein